MIKNLQRLFLLLFAASITLSCSSNSKKSGWELYNLEGKVKSFEQHLYKAVAKEGKIVKGEMFQEANAPKNKKVNFDKDGNVTKELNFNAKDSVVLSITYEYNWKGNKTLETWNLGDGTLFMKRKFKYDGGLLMETSSFDAEENMKSRQTYEYDSKDHKTFGYSFAADGSQNATWSYKYDGVGHLTEENSYNAQGQTIYLRTLVYNNQGAIASQEWMLPNGTSSNWSYQYNDKGNLTLTKASYEDGSHMKETYVLDDQGNWIQATHFKNDVPTYILERKFVYFKP